MSGPTGLEGRSGSRHRTGSGKRLTWALLARGPPSIVHGQDHRYRGS
jgi:hypothetical protein